MINDELITRLFDESKKRSLKLPDRMNQPATMAKVWINVFGNRRKLKAVADDLKKSSALTLFPRVMQRVLDPEIIVGSLLLTREGRYSVFDEHLYFNYSVWVSLMRQVHTRVSKKLPLVPAPLELLGFELGSYDIQMDEEKSSDVSYLKCLASYVTEKTYIDLGSDDKDLADFFINTALCEIGDHSFIIDFLDKYPFLKNRNKLLYEGAVDLREEEQSELDEMDFGDFAAECANHLAAMGKADRPGHLLNLLGVAQLVDKVVNDPRFGLRNELTSRINNEKQHLVSFVENTVSKAVLIPSLKDMPVWQKCIDLIADLKTDLDTSTLSPSVADAITDYCRDRDEFQKTMIAFPDQFAKTLEEFRRLKAEVAEEALRDDSDGDSIIKKSAKVVEANAELITTSEKAGVAFVTLLTGLSQLWVRLNQDDGLPLALTHDKPVSAQLPQAKDLSPAVEVDSEALAQWEAEKKVLLEKLEKMNTHVSEMEELTSSLEEENASVKRENHTLKQRVAYEPPKPEERVPLDVSDKTLIALITQSRAPNPEEILRFYQSMAPERLEVLDSAFESAKDADNFHLPYRLSELMHKLIYEYLDLIKSGNPDAEARKVFGKGYSAKESETVTSNKRLRAMREFYYGGENVLFLQHLSVGRNYGTQLSIRVYFKVIEGKVVIAYCGSHLDTMSTN